MIRTTKEYISLSLKGMAMGAADIIPGVSGGTIAFISGIYEELIETINNVNFEAIKKLKKYGIESFWTHINGNFLIALLTGIAISIISLAKVITHLLETHSQLLWGFFFGLILASVYIVGKQVNKWDINNIISLIIGSSIAFYITILNQKNFDNKDKIFNVGYENLSVMKLAELVKKNLNKNIEITRETSDDNRSYHISSDRIFKQLNFRNKFTTSDAINDLKQAFDKNKFREPLENKKYFNIKMMKSINLS